MTAFVDSSHCPFWAERQQPASTGCLLPRTVRQLLAESSISVNPPKAAAGWFALASDWQL